MVTAWLATILPLSHGSGHLHPEQWSPTAGAAFDRRQRMSLSEDSVSGGEGNVWLGRHDSLGCLFFFCGLIDVDELNFPNLSIWNRSIAQSMDRTIVGENWVVWLENLDRKISKLIRRQQLEVFSCNLEGSSHKPGNKKGSEFDASSHSMRHQVADDLSRYDSTFPSSKPLRKTFEGSSNPGFVRCPRGRPRVQELASIRALEKMLKGFPSSMLDIKFTMAILELRQCVPNVWDIVKWTNDVYIYIYINDKSAGSGSWDVATKDSRSISRTFDKQHEFLAA